MKFGIEHIRHGDRTTQQLLSVDKLLDCIHGWRKCFPAALLLLPVFIYTLQPVAHATGFSTSNQHPFIAVYGLPVDINHSALPPGKRSTELRLDVTSNFSDAFTANENIELDGETYRAVLSLRRNFANQGEWALHLPLVAHDSGFLDSFIVDWHRFWGFSQGGRDQVPRNRLRYRYIRDGSVVTSLDEPAGGIGDLSIGYTRPLQKEGARALQFNAQLELPTGNSDKLLGSGSTDLALWLSANQKFKPWGRAVHSRAAAGILLMTDGKVLPDQHKNSAVFGSFGLGTPVTKRLELMAQLDWHSRFFAGSDVRQLDQWASQLTVGGAIHLTQRYDLEVGVSEDAFPVDASPDVVFHLAVRSR